jgi:hypothetical protein
MDEFYSAQQQLAERVASGSVRFVYLDPEECWPYWLAVIIEHPTGVVYGQQCGGTATDQRYVEGYYVPLGGARLDAADGPLESLDFTSLFHNGARCTHGWGIQSLPEDRLNKLRSYIEEIPYWHHTNLHNYVRERVRIDVDRVGEICEAWVPVVTPEGKGILVWANCD